jgi:N utilization substance protein A
MINKELIAIFDYMEKERGIKRERVMEAIKDSLRLAARKSIQDVSEIDIEIDPKTGEIEVLAKKQVVEEVEDSAEQISLEDALELNPDCEMGDWLQVEVTPKDFGRIAAQKARQAISMKLRMAERDVIYEEYRDRVGEIISGTVKRFVRKADVIVDLGKVEGFMPMSEYPRTERYQVGDRVVALLWEVQDTPNGGAEVVLSRSRPEFVYQLFTQEVPEIGEGSIEIVRIARDAGYRTKIAVEARDAKVDPVGACVGMRGIRVKNIIRELNNEKIDILPYTSDTEEMLRRALSPIEPRNVIIDEEKREATVVVDDEDYPIVLGRKGMNARLCADLIDMEVKVHRSRIYQKQMALERRALADSEDSSLDDKIKSLEGINRLVLDHLVEAGYDTPRKLLMSMPEDLASLPGVTLDLANQILETVKKQRVARLDQESEA